MAINLEYVNEDDIKTFKNTGDLVESMVITQTYNLVNTDGKSIDLRRINTDNALYINLGSDVVTPDEINTIYNSIIE